MISANTQASATPVPRSVARKRRKSSRLVGDAERLMPRWAAPIVVGLLLIAVLVPLGYMLILSVTPNNDVALGTITFARLAFDNYVNMWSQAPLASGLVHTLIIAGIAAIASAALGLLAAYPLTRFGFKGRNSFLYGLIGFQTVPGTTLLLPFFAVMSWIQTTVGLHIIGSYPLIIITYMTFGLPLSTWVLVLYLRAIPRDLEEAALVDGASRLGALRRVVLPIALPALVVAFVLAFLVGWNDVLFASVFTNTSTQTLAIALQRFSSLQANTSLPLYGELMAAAVVSAVPVVLIYLIFQRHLVHGLSAGSLTGV